MRETESQAPRRGRPPLAPEDRAAKAPRRNVSLDPEAAALLGDVAKELESVFGFLPSLSQTVRYLAKLARERAAGLGA